MKCAESRELILVGDLSCDVSKVSLDPHTRQLTFLCSLYQIDQLIDEPTRVTATTIDLVSAQAAQTLFVIYIRDSIALRFEPFKRMYENGSNIALNSTCRKGFELFQVCFPFKWKANLKKFKSSKWL